MLHRCWYSSRIHHKYMRACRRPITTFRSVVDVLESRGMVQATTSRALKQHLAMPGEASSTPHQYIPRTIYSGVDPSAPSLHVGNLLPLVALLHCAIYGHKVLVLIGGATGAIGDPSGRSSERSGIYCTLNRHSLVPANSNPGKMIVYFKLLWIFSLSIILIGSVISRCSTFYLVSVAMSVSMI